jgi:hypothetical protein
MPQQAVVQPAEKQLALPFTRDERMQLVAAFRRKRLSIIGGKMRTNLAELLEIVELNSGNDGCRLSRALLAAKLGTINVTTLNRWLKSGEELGVIQKAARYLHGGKGRQAENLIRIDWFCVRRLVGESLPSIGETLFDVHGWDEDGETSVHGEASYAHGETESVHGSTDPTIPPRVETDVDARPSSAPPGGANAPPGGALLQNGWGAFHQNATPMVNGLKAKDDLQATEPIDPIFCPSKNPISYHSTHLPLGGRFASGVAPLDRCELSIDLLKSPQGIQKWFEFALGRQWVREIDRLRVFTAARSVIRRIAGMSNPCGAFVRIVKREAWHAASLADEDWGQKAIRWLDNQRLTAGH